MDQVVGIITVAFILAILGSSSVTWLVRDLALARGWVRAPLTERHIHTKPIPRLGGIAIYSTFLLVTILGTIAVAALRLPFRFESSTLLAIMLPATGLFVVGVVDDFVDLRARTKLAFQVFAGVGLFLAGLRAISPDTIVYGHSVGMTVSLCVTVIWVIAVSNAVNIIDGLDGLAAGSALFSCMSFCALAAMKQDFTACFLCLVLSGCLIGFLRFNYNPASIFLGDGGSLFIGFVLSALALAAKPEAVDSRLSLVVPAIALGFPIIETSVSVLRRFIRGHRIFEPDRSHIHHRLLSLGMTQRQVVTILYGFSGICAVVSVALVYPRPRVGVWMICGFLGITVLGLRHLKYAEFKELQKWVTRAAEQKRKIVHNVGLRSVAEALSSARDFESIYAALASTIPAAGVTQFELVVATIVDSNPRATEAVAKTFYWAEGDIRSEAPTGTWSFSLDLTGETVGDLGEFRIRGSIDSSILFDINILRTEVKPALAQAVERAVLAKVAASSKGWSAKKFGPQKSRQNHANSASVQ